MDLLIKNYFDRYRRLGRTPPKIKDKIRGKPLGDFELLRRWRNWRSGLRYEDKQLNAVLFGALDECFVDGEYYIPVDYKTRGFELKEDLMKYYQTQLDCYTLLLQANGYKHLNLSFLIYFIPPKDRGGWCGSF